MDRTRDRLDAKGTMDPATRDPKNPRGTVHSYAAVPSSRGEYP